MFMDSILEILKYILPMLVLGGIFYFVIEKFFAEETVRRRIELQLKDKELLTPQRLQAYERMALFLERIRPTNLIRRISMPEDVASYEYMLFNAVQEEFDHNLSQQIYIDPETWKIIFSAKNATQSFIKQCKESCEDPNSVEAFRDELIKKSVDGNAISNGALLKLQADVQGQF